MAASPCRCVLRLALVLPAAVRGLQLLRLLRRFAVILRCDVIRCAFLRRSERRCCTLFQLSFDLVEFGVEDFACRLLRELPQTCPIALQLLQRIISPRHATGDELIEPFLEEDALSECAIVLKFRRSTFHYFVSIRQHFGETILQRHQPRDVGGLGEIFLRVLPCQILLSCLLKFLLLRPQLESFSRPARSIDTVP